jgi:PhnB protein
MAYKPNGYTSVAPYLIVADAEKTLAFLEAALGAERLRIIRRDDHSIKHAEARIDDTVVMMGEMPPGQEANVHVYVPDVDQAFASAIAAGGVVVQAVESKGDGDRRGGVRDPNGITWWLATEEDPA